MVPLLKNISLSSNRQHSSAVSVEMGVVVCISYNIGVLELEAIVDDN